MDATPPGWYRDPTSRFTHRWWDGHRWTHHVGTGDRQLIDPLPEVDDERHEIEHNKTSNDARDPANRADLHPKQNARSPRDLNDFPSAQSSQAPPHIEHVTSGREASPASDNHPSDTGRESDRKITVFNARRIAQELQQENAELRQRNQAMSSTLHGMGALTAAEIAERTAIARRHLDELNEEHKRTAERLGASRAALERELKGLERKIVSSKDQIELEDRGLFYYEHPAESSTTLAASLASVRSQISTLNRNGKAIRATSNFTFNGSFKQGERFVKQMSRIMLRAYNAEAENAVKTVKAGNLDSALRRLSKAQEQIAKQGTMIDLSVTHQYHELRLREIELAAQHLQAVKIEKEREREHREELREMRRAEMELQREKERLEKERSHYQNALLRVEAGGDEAARRALEERLAEIDEKIADADYRAANHRAGYVYVISNIGSFGEGVVKIGMTRRLDPMDRVRELGDASVPFRFDVHALFFSKDAAGVEAMLHRTFAEHRLNHVNHRKEFFRVKPSQVLQVLQREHVAVLEFSVEADAEEYRASSAMAAKR